MVYFYRLHAGRDDEGDPIEYDLRGALRHIDGLSFDDGSRYVDEPNDGATGAWVDLADPPRPSRFRMATVRRSDLPSVEQRGRFKALNLAPGEGIAEQTHFVAFDKGIVGMLYNHYGPRSGKFSSYMLIQCPHIQGPAQLSPLLRADVVQQIRRFESISLLDLSIRQDAIDTLRDGDPTLADAFDGVERFMRAEKVQLVLQAEARDREGLGAKALRVVNALARKAGVTDSLDRFIVRGRNADTGGLVDIDVLREQFMSRQQVVLIGARSRALKRMDAYRAIERAHAELAEDMKYSSYCLY